MRQLGTGKQVAKCPIPRQKRISTCTASSSEDEFRIMKRSRIPAKSGPPKSSNLPDGAIIDPSTDGYIAIDIVASHRVLPLVEETEISFVSSNRNIECASTSHRPKSLNVF